MAGGRLNLCTGAYLEWCLAAGRGASVPIKIPMALNGSFMESGQGDLDSADEGSLQVSSPLADSKFVSPCC